MPYIDVDKLIAYFQGEWDWHDCQCVKQFAEEGEFECNSCSLDLFIFLQINVLTVGMKQVKVGGPLSDVLNVGHIWMRCKYDKDGM